MKADLKLLEKGQAQLVVEVPIAETEDFLIGASKRLAHKKAVPGFRPGKAPVHVLKAQFGEMALLEEALQELVPHTLWDALKEHKLETVGRPDIAIEKLAPGNAIVYRATIAIMPQLKLGEWRSIRISRTPVAVSDAEVEKLLEDLRAMQASEVVVVREARSGDRVDVNFEIRMNGVLIDGGRGVQYPVIIGRGAFIPGFEEHIIGLKASDKKQFKLTFPQPYFKEQLAGKEADFYVEVTTVYERSLPEKNDAWAQKVMGKSYVELIEAFRNNLKDEKAEEERHRLEQDIVERIIVSSSFTDIPDIMINAEVEKMLAELQEDVLSRGMQWEQYLKSVKKTKDVLASEFRSFAEKRVKGALILRQLASDLGVLVTDAEVADEVKRLRDRYASNVEALENIGTDEYRRYISVALSNRKVIEKLLEQLVV